MTPYTQLKTRLATEQRTCMVSVLRLRRQQATFET